MIHRMYLYLGENEELMNICMVMNLLRCIALHRIALHCVALQKMLYSNAMQTGVYNK